MTVINCLFTPTRENPQGFLVWWELIYIKYNCA